MPDVEKFSNLDILDIIPGAEPCHDPLQLSLRIGTAGAKLDHKVQILIRPATPAITSVGFDGFFDKRIEEIVNSLFPAPRDDDLSSPLGEFTVMFFLAKSLLHYLPSRFILLITSEYRRNGAQQLVDNILI
jgi:hypothetical protein